MKWYKKFAQEKTFKISNVAKITQVQSKKTILGL